MMLRLAALAFGAVGGTMLPEAGLNQDQ